MNPSERTRTAIGASQLLLLVLLAVLSSACGQRSEREQLAALRDSFAYKRYRQLSEPGLPIALESYRRSLQLADKPVPAPFTAQDICAGRVLLAYSALTAGKHTVVIAETDIVEVGACEPALLSAAFALRSIGFHRQQWPTLAAEENLRAWQGDDPQASATTAMVLHIALGYAAVVDQRWDRALVHIDGLALLLQQPWLSKVGRAGLAFHEGRHLEGLQTVKRISEDPATPPAVRIELGRFIATVESHTGDLDASALIPRLIAKLLWQSVQQEGGLALGAVTRFIDEQAWKPLNDSLGATFEGSRAWWQRWRKNKEEAADAPAASQDEPR